MPTITLIPAFLVILYAAVVKIRRHKRFDAILFLLGGGIALFNAFFVYKFFVGEPVSWTLRFWQQILASLLVPIAYVFFTDQVGRKRFNGVTVALLSLMGLLLIPVCLVTPDGAIATAGLPEVLEPMTINFVRHGSIVYTMHTADFVILLQALIAILRMLAFSTTIHRYRLSIPSRVRYYFIWWVLAGIFVLFTSLHTTEEFSQPRLMWAYYIGYSVMLMACFFLLSLDIDLHPVLKGVESGTPQAHEDENKTETKKTIPVMQDAQTEVASTVVSDLDNFILQYRIMADRVRMMMRMEKFLDPTLSEETIVRYLGTNPILFRRMMRMEFGCNFDEYVTRQREEYERRTNKVKE